MDENTSDTVKIRALPQARYPMADGRMLEQLGDNTYRLTDMAGNHLGYLAAAPSIELKSSLEQEYQAMRVRDGAEVIRLLDHGIDRTPRAV